MDFSAGLEFWLSTAERRQGGTLITVFGELDASASPRLRAALADAIENGDVELDMRGCGFVDSTGIATVVWAAWRLKERDLRLLIVGAHARVLSILELAGVLEHSAIEVESPE